MTIITGAVVLCAAFAFGEASYHVSAKPVTDEAIQHLHGNCVMKLFEQPETRWYSDAVWTCDEIFSDYFCVLYPLNSRCI